MDVNDVQFVKQQGAVSGFQQMNLWRCRDGLTHSPHRTQFNNFSTINLTALMIDWCLSFFVLDSNYIRIKNPNLFWIKIVKQTWSHDSLKHCLCLLSAAYKGVFLILICVKLHWQSVGNQLLNIADLTEVITVGIYWYTHIVLHTKSIVNWLGHWAIRVHKIDI